MFKIKTVPLCPDKILQTYQADEISGINIAGKFLVKTKDKEFNTTIYPFLQTDYLVDQLTGKAYHFGSDKRDLSILSLVKSTPKLFKPIDLHLRRLFLHGRSKIF